MLSNSISMNINSVQNYIISMNILEWLGGRRFLSATKSKEPITLEKGFQIRLSLNKLKANYLHIFLESNGHYSVTFIHSTLAMFKIVRQFANICGEQLRPLFESESGLLSR